MNELPSEKSPYLLQHAQNPVHWKAWSPQSLELAKKRNLPIFVSIGYSTCHWCHVMEHESFENHQIADYLNQNFTCIKIDREEHPDVDSIYMNAVQLMTGRGGWPLNVFLDTDLKTFYGGTYFRPQMFLNLISKISEAWNTNRKELTAQGEHVYNHLLAMQKEPSAGSALTTLPLEKYFSLFESNYDRSNGGKLGAPKFPLSYDISLLAKLNSNDANQMIRHTIAKMARGGIYDHLEGGLHRYSTDDEWKVPHFEKMLYDQSSFVEACLSDHIANQSAESLFVAQRTVDYVLDRLQTADGAFFSAEDADSEGVEGKFYRWDESELKSPLGEENFKNLIKTLDWPAGGNFEGHYVLHIESSQNLHEWHQTFAGSVRKLQSYRAKRIRPITDTKVLTAWNGLFLSSLAKFIQVSGTTDGKYRKALERAVAFLKKNVFDAASGEVYRRWADGEAKYRGTLADYTCLISGLIDTFAVIPSADTHLWIESLLKKQEELFSDAVHGFYWTTPHDEPNILIREIEVYDNVEPAANSLALRNLSLWYALCGDEKYLKRLERMTAKWPVVIATRPHGFPALLSAALDLQNGISTYFVVTDDQDRSREATKKLLTDNTNGKLVIQVSPDHTDLKNISWISDKLSSGKAFAIYHCKNQVCDAPVD